MAARGGAADRARLRVHSIVKFALNQFEHGKTYLANPTPHDLTFFTDVSVKFDLREGHGTLSLEDNLRNHGIVVHKVDPTHAHPIFPVKKDEQASGAQLFAVCAGLQIIGESFPGVSGEIIAGLGMVPIVSLPGSDRIVGEVLVKSDLFTEPLTGFENHRGRTDLGGLSPLGRVLVGGGNGGEAIAINERVDGLVAGNILATYLHGPALTRNPVLADHLLSRVVGALPKVPEGEEIAELLALERRRALGAANFGK